MTERIVIIQGHPDGDGHHLCHALADSYAQAAIKAEHDVRILDVGKLEFPLIQSKMEWENDPIPSSLQEAQNDLLWGEHWVLFYPIWLGAMPAMLKGFLEQVLRPGLSYVESEPGQMWDQLLVGRSARIVVTMSTPAMVYRVFYGAHTVKSLERNILKFCGIDPVKTTLIGDVYKASSKTLERSIAKMSEYGAKGI